MLATLLKGATAAAAANIEYVGGYVFGFSGSTSTQTVPFSGSLTGGLANSPSIGDLIIVYFGTGSTADRNLVVTDTTTGDPYTEVVELYSNDTFDTNLVVAYRFSTQNGGFINLVGSTGSASDAGAVAIQVWRGVDPTTPFDVAEKPVTDVNTVEADFENITPATPGAIILAGAAGAHNAGTRTYSSSNLTAFRTVGANDTNDVTIGLGYHVWTSGSFTPNQLTFSGTDSVNFSYASCVLALRPA